jgi:GR25 family glycosyltransferase involved in LPS biosynthesis/tetratricopeptide (TPR) repeat protein
MIVRDAADFVAETLASVTEYIDCWLVVDTGSVDDTADVVTAFFENSGIPGELVHRPWVGYAHNRTEALHLARGRADFAFMLDADDLVVGELPLADLDDAVDCFRLRFGPDFVFWRPALFRLDRGLEYRGAVHEYVEVPDGGRTANLEGPYYLVFRSLGGRSKDVSRLQGDVDALTTSWSQDPGDSRTAFYLAQSHRDAGDTAKALEWYRRRVSMVGSDEETFVAALEVARCLYRLGAPDDEVIAAYMEAHEQRPTRAEPLHEIARLHRVRGRWSEGHREAVRAADIPLPANDLLFVQADVYRWKITDERAICAHFLGLHDEAVECCEVLLGSPHLPSSERERILLNRDYSLAHLLEDRAAHRPERVAALVAALGSPAADHALVTLTITTCRRRELFERTIDSFLECCIDHHHIGRWICIDDGSSAQDRDAMRARYPFFEFIFKSIDDRGHASSMNALLQEVHTPYWLHLEDDWDFVSKSPIVEQAMRVLDDDPTLLQVVLNRNYAETLEQRLVVGGEALRTADGFPYRRHTHLPAGSTELQNLLWAHPGHATNAHWPGFSLMPSMIRTAAIKDVGAFNVGAGQFERDFATRAQAKGWSTGFLDTIVCVTTGKRRNDNSPGAPLNAYALNGLPQFQNHGEIRLAVVANWTTSEALTQQWRRQFPAGSAWRGVRLVDQSEGAPEPDFWVVVNHPPPGVDPPPEKTILLQMEPAVGVAGFGAWASPDRSRVLHVRGHDMFANTLEWHLAATYDELSAMPIVKTRLLSAVVSSKRQSPGHHLRLDLLHALEQANVSVDIYGTDNAEGFAGYMGSLPWLDKRDGLFPYRYTIAAENHAETNYLTEKVVDAVLAETLCFYWGCPNIEDHIDAEALIQLPLDDIPASIDIIRAAIESNAHERRLPAIRRAKRRLLDEQQLAPTLSRVARGALLIESLDVHVINLDRRPDRLLRFMSRLSTVAGEQFAQRCQRFAAFDSKDLLLTDEIAHMFRGSDLPLRRAQTACALSHLALWWQIATGDGRAGLVFEDDAEPNEGFTGRLVEIVGRLTEPGAEADVVFLGLAHWSGVTPPTSNHQTDIAVDLDGVMGGTFAYIISRDGARRLWELATRDGIPSGIDTFVLRQAALLRIRQAVPPLACTPVARRDSPTIDSDIQYDDGVL